MREGETERQRETWSLRERERGREGLMNAREGSELKE
jgi:hypothetical protein